MMYMLHATETGSFGHTQLTIQLTIQLSHSNVLQAKRAMGGLGHPRLSYGASKPPGSRPHAQLRVAGYARPHEDRACLPHHGLPDAWVIFSSRKAHCAAHFIGGHKQLQRTRYRWLDQNAFAVVVLTTESISQSQ
jgi:hypothetical protein